MSAEEGHSGNSLLLESCSEPEFQCHRNLGGFNTWGLGLLFLFTPEMGQKALHFFMDPKSRSLFSEKHCSCCVPGAFLAARAAHGFETASLGLVLSGNHEFLQDVLKQCQGAWRQGHS